MNFLGVQNAVQSFLPQTKASGTLIQCWINQALQNVERLAPWPFLETDVSNSLLAGDKQVTIDGILFVTAFRIGSNKPPVYVEPAALDRLDPSAPSAATPVFWTWRHRASGGSNVNPVEIKFWPALSAGATYYARVGQASPALSADTDTNWWTDNAPDVLIYGALVAGGVFVSSKKAEEFNVLYQRAVASVGRAYNMEVASLIGTGQRDSQTANSS